MNKKENDYEVRQALEAFYDNISLLMEDRGWNKIDKNAIFGEDMAKEERKALVERSVFYSARYPAYRQVLELNKAFVLGKGLQRPVSKNPLIQFVIDSLWDSIENQRTFSSFIALEAQKEQLDVAGEVFYKIYVDEQTGEIVIRVDKGISKIKEVVTEDGDIDKALFYIYELVRKEFNFATNKQKIKSALIRIPDILNTDEEQIKKYGAAKDNVRLYGYMAAFGDNCSSSLRGLPLYRTIFPWLRAHKEVAEDVATILKVMSTYAWKKKFKKGISKEQVEGIKNVIKTFTAGGDINNPKPAVGSTLLEGDNVDNMPIETKHNAAAFWDTSRLLMQQIASGSQKMEHYFGNPSNANLATATSMELPMLKDFERQQKEFACMLENVLKFAVYKVVKIKGEEEIFKAAKNKGYDLPAKKEEIEAIKKEIKEMTYETVDISVYMPDILTEGVERMITATIASYSSGLIGERDASYSIYSLLKFQNVDDKVADFMGDFESNLPKADRDPEAIKALQEQILKDEKRKLEEKVKP